MFQNSGLSLNQAPPIMVVLRLFLIGSIFGLVASIMLFFWHDSLTDISSSKTLALTHTLTLGLMGSFMLGALFQMMPVLCGVFIKSPENIAIRVTYTLAIGTIFLVTSFLYTNTILTIFAMIFLSLAIFSSVYIISKELFKIKHSSSSKGMLVSILLFALAAMLGILMLSLRAGFEIDINYLNLKALHFNIALFGWIAMLIVSVSFQVIEMFYVAPSYKKIYSNYLPISIFILLLLYSFNQFIPIFSSVINIVIAIYMFHAIYTLINIKRKKRPISDATFWFWIVGMISLSLFGIVYILDISTILSATLFVSFAISILFAMSYKIVPFLVWFHLNAKGYFDAPMMYEVISPKYAKINLYIFIVAIFTLIIATKFILLYYISSTLLLISFIMLYLAIYGAISKYNYTLINGKKFNF